MKTRTFIAAGLALHARIIAATRHCIFRRAWLWTGFLAFAAIAFGPRPARAAVTEAWVQRYSNVVSNSYDQAHKVVLDAAGDVIVTGSTAGGLPGKDLLTIKYSGADGSVRWQQRYDGPADNDDPASALAVDGSDNVVVAGFFEEDYYTAKYAAADGALLWEKHNNNPANSARFASALAVDGNGNVVVMQSFVGATNIDSYTARYAAADGALL